MTATARLMTLSRDFMQFTRVPEYDEWKTPRERSPSGPGSEYDVGEELGDDEGSN